MCLKFQLTRTSTRPTVAMAMCCASARILDGSTPAVRYGLRKVSGLRVKRERLEVRLRNGRKPPPNPDWRCRQFLDGETGQHQDSVTADKTIQEADGVLGKLRVFTASQDRRVGVNPQPHRHIL
jgi:hypothetical protein